MEQRKHQFSFHLIEQLPRLAWCARVRPGQSTIDVWHGPWVEVWKDGFVEGAWDGPFSDRGFDESAAFAGTGAVNQDGRVRFISGTDLQARLYATEIGDTVCVSNSLPFVMVASSSRLSERFGHYSGEFLHQCILGINRTRRDLPMEHGSVRVHECVDLEIQSGPSLHRINKVLLSAPGNYEEYVGTLGDAIGRTIDNAIDESRVHQFNPVVTLSRGYDSVMVAALAATRGCREALTFIDPPRPGVEPAEDSGRMIGERLGMSVEEFSHIDFHRHGTPAEAEFCAYPPAIDFPLATLEKHLEGRMLMTGSFGDCILSKSPSSAQRDFRQSTFQGMCGSTMTEFRLRVGCINFPPLFINGLHVEEVRRISCSEEMSPWSVGGDYDRPIARRCGVESGIPTEWFGVRKYGSGWGLLKCVSELSDASQSDFRTYLDGPHPPSHPILARMTWGVMRQYLRLLWGLGLGNRQMRLIPGVLKRFTRDPIEDQFFRWGIDRTTSRYREVFESE